MESVNRFALHAFAMIRYADSSQAEPGSGHWQFIMNPVKTAKKRVAVSVRS
jgi:hypothetical protein